MRPVTRLGTIVAYDQVTEPGKLASRDLWTGTEAVIGELAKPTELVRCWIFTCSSRAVALFRTVEEWTEADEAFGDITRFYTTQRVNEVWRKADNLLNPPEPKGEAISFKESEEGSFLI